jgi:hypothetical protein
VPFSAAGGEHVFSLGVFNADRSLLSDSLGARRGQVSLDDGGVSNTNGAESWTATLSGEFGETAYNFGVQHQAAGSGDATDQDGVVRQLVQSPYQVSIPCVILKVHPLITWRRFQPRWNCLRV